MNQKTNCLRALWQGLDRIAITERFHCETAVCNKNKNTARIHTKDWELRFSLLRGLLVLGATLVTAMGSLWLWKKCVEMKLMARLKKKYFLLPVEQAAKETEQQD